MKKILLATPTMHTEEQQYIQKAFETNWISPLGPNVDEFEDKVAAYVGASSSAALSSGTAALHLSLVLAGVKENDIVFVPSLTFAASVNPIRYEYATPVFIDSERDTWNMDAAALRKAFEKYPHPKAVMAVHLYGTSANISIGTISEGINIFQISMHMKMTVVNCRKVMMWAAMRCSRGDRPWFCTVGKRLTLAKACFYLPIRTWHLIWG